MAALEEGEQRAVLPGEDHRTARRPEPCCGLVVRPARGRVRCRLEVDLSTNSCRRRPASRTRARASGSADADLEEAVRAFAEQPVRRLPVLDGGTGVGVVTADDLIVDLVNDLDRVLRPVTAQVLFGGPEPRTPATT